MPIKMINYKLLKVEDKNLYRQIRLDCLKMFPDNFGSTYDEELNKKSLKFDESLEYTDSSNFIFGAFDNYNLIGICGFTQENKLKTIHQGEITQMYVNPSFGRQGIGTTLLKLTIDKAFGTKSVEQILLGVLYSNEEAISVYKKFGFKQCGLIENYFKQGDKYWTKLFMILTKDKYNEAQIKA